MVHKMLLLLTLLLLQYVHGNYLSETNTEFHLKNEHTEIHISKKTGNITAIIAEGKNLLSQESTVDINIHSKKSEGKIVEIDCKDNYPQFARVYIKQEWREAFLEHQFIIDSLALRWQVEIFCKSNVEQEVFLNFKIPAVKKMSHLFYPAQDTVFSINKISTQIRTYRRSFLIPIFCVYNSEEDYGLSIIAPFEISKPSLTFSADKENLIVTYNHLRLTENRKIKVAIYVVPHEGGWRPGLNFLLNKYPEYFYPAVENTKIGEGWYYLGNPFDNKNKIMQLKNHGVKWIELHGHFPFYGLYTPKQKDWGIIMNSDKISLNNWEKGVGKKSNSYKNMQNLINLWHKYGIQVYLYFQSFEAWHQYAEKYFAVDIARNKWNRPHSAWKLCNLMNPDPMSKWGKYIIGQAKDLIEKYPMIDGVFYDRMDYWEYDFAHDDGITMIDDKSAYMLGFALEKINETIFDIFHKNKKGIWGNNPTSIEVCKNLDGIMAEIHPSALCKIQYLGLVKPIIFLTKDRTPKETQEKLKYALLYGAYPSITFGDVKCQKLDEKYVSLFDLIKNRKWVLSKNPIEIPEGFRGNIFRTPTGDYVAIIISPVKSQLIPHPFEYEIPIIINIPDADEIKHVYLLSGDWSGVNTIDFKRKKTALKINLPYHLSCSSILLSKKRKYEMTRVSSPILIKERNEDLIFRIENPTDKKTCSLETPWLKQTKAITSNKVKFNTRVPKDTDGEVEIKVRYNGKEYKMSCWIVDAISITPKEDVFIKFNEGEDILFYITNNSNKKRSIDINGRFIKGSGKVKTPTQFLLQPLEHKEIKIPIVAKTDGIIQLTLISKKEEIRKLFPLKVALFFSESDLFHDDFKKGMGKWTLNRGKWSVVNCIAKGSGSSHFAFIKNVGWKDYEFEVRTKILGSDNPAVDWLKSYIFFRLQDEKNFYRFGIHGDAGIIDLHKCVDGKWIRIGSSFFTPERDKWYALRIWVKGTKITGYINGKKIIEANDDTFSTGGIGIGVLEDAMRCEYNDVVVKKL